MFEIWYRWLGARLQYLHCQHTEDTAVLHSVIDIILDYLYCTNIILHKSQIEEVAPNHKNRGSYMKTEIAYYLAL